MTKVSPGRSMMLAEFELDVCRYRLGLIGKPEVIDAADRLLTCAYSPALAAMALDVKPSLAATDVLLEQALAEVGIADPTRERAFALLLNELFLRLRRARGFDPERLVRRFVEEHRLIGNDQDEFSEKLVELYLWFEELAEFADRRPPATLRKLRRHHNREARQLARAWRSRRARGER